jgi:hypothetical protein
MIALRSLLRLFLMLAMLTACVASASAQPSKSAAPFTLEDVVKLHQNGVSEETIITKIKKNGKAFDLSADEVIELKKLGIQDKVIDYLLDPSLPYTPPAPAPVKAPDAPTAPQQPSPPPKQYPKDENVAKIPPDPGLYQVDGDGSVSKSDIKLLLAAAEGPGLGKVLMKKGKVLGYLVGSAAKTRIKGLAPVFYLRLADGKGIEEVVLISLDRKNGRREIEMGPPGPKQEFKAGAARPFDPLEVGPRIFRLTVMKLAPGEYVFFLLGSADPPKGSAGKGYDFGVDPPKK